VNTLQVNCSWCKHPNSLVIGARNLCRSCGHRCDLARVDCDCPRCMGLWSPDNQTGKKPTQEKITGKETEQKAIACKGSGTSEAKDSDSAEMKGDVR